MKIYVAIPTYNRPEGLSRLLLDLLATSAGFDIEVGIFDDHSDTAILPIIKPFIGGALNIDLFRYPFNHGKCGYTRLVSDIMLHARERTFDYFLVLQDDLRLTPTFLTDWIWIFEAIKDPKKIALGTYSPGNVSAARWGRPAPAKAKAGTKDIWKTNWIDGCFGCTKKGLNLISYQIPTPDPERWAKNPAQSSGAGEYLSKQWAGYGLYHPIETLSWNEDITASVMQPEERKKTPL